MLSEKFLEEMWGKCYWTRDFLPGGISSGPEWPGPVTLNSNQLRDLLDEIKTLTDDAKQRRLNNIRLEGENATLRDQVKNPVVTSLWGKPMEYWIELEKSISSWEYPSGLAWHNWQLKEENRELQSKLTEAINTNTKMRRTIELIRAALG